MTPTPTPPGGGEELKNAHTLEVGRIVQLSNQRGDLAARAIVADDIVKLRAENERLKAALAAAESRYAEERESHHKVVAVQMGEIGDLLKRNEALEALAEQQRDRLSSLESRHAEEMREARREGWNAGWNHSYLWWNNIDQTLEEPRALAAFLKSKEPQ